MWVYYAALNVGFTHLWSGCVCVQVVIGHELRQNVDIFQQQRNPAPAISQITYTALEVEVIAAAAADNFVDSYLLLVLQPAPDAGMLYIAAPAAVNNVVLVTSQCAVSTIVGLRKYAGTYSLSVPLISIEWRQSIWCCDVIC